MRIVTIAEVSDGKGMPVPVWVGAWYAAQRLAPGNARHNPNPLAGPDNPAHPRRKSSSFLLSGLVRCARCGSPLNGHLIQTSKSPTARAYYVCARRQRRADCDAPRIPRHTIEQLVLSALADALDPAQIAARQADLEATAGDRIADLRALERAAAGQLAEVRRQIINVNAVVRERGSAAPRSLVDSLVDLERQEIELQSLHRQHLADLKAALDPQPVQPMQTTAAEIRELIKKTQDQEILRQIVHSQTASVTANRDGNTVQAYIVFYHPPTPAPGGNPYAYVEVPPRRFELRF